MDCSTSGFPVQHQLLEIAQNHLHQVGDAIQPFIFCHPLLFLPSMFYRIRSFPMSQFFVSGGQSTGIAASVSALPMNIQGLFPLGWTGCISFCSSRNSQESSPSPQSQAPVLQCSAFSIIQLSQPYMTTGKNIALTRWTFVGIVMSLLFNMPSLS